MPRRDLIYAARAKRAGARHTIKTVQEARKAGIPLSWAFALVEQESDFRNVFGHDRGSILHGQRVTRARVRQLLVFFSKGGNSNGVGLTQLTSVSLIRLANELGGAHVPRNQLRVGFQYFKQVSQGFYRTRGWHYNGAPSYQAPLTAKHDKWHKILVGRKP